MSVLVKGMKMPKECFDCPMNDDYIACGVLPDYPDTIAHGKLPDCPLVELPQHDCDNCKNRNDCGTHIVIELIRTGGKEAFVGCKGYEPKFITVNCPNCGCQIHIDPTIIEAEEVYGQYTDTAGNFHWCGTHSGEHTIKAEES